MITKTKYDKETNEMKKVLQFSTHSWDQLVRSINYGEEEFAKWNLFHFERQIPADLYSQGQKAAMFRLDLLVDYSKRLIEMGVDENRKGLFIGNSWYSNIQNIGLRNEALVLEEEEGQHSDLFLVFEEDIRSYDPDEIEIAFVHSQTNEEIVIRYDGAAFLVDYTTTKTQKNQYFSRSSLDEEGFIVSEMRKKLVKVFSEK